MYNKVCDKKKLLIQLSTEIKNIFEERQEKFLSSLEFLKEITHNHIENLFS